MKNDLEKEYRGLEVRQTPFTKYVTLNRLPPLSPKLGF
jgi:hypothetical protein